MHPIKSHSRHSITRIHVYITVPYRTGSTPMKSILTLQTANKKHICITYQKAPPFTQNKKEKTKKTENKNQKGENQNAHKKQKTNPYST